MVSFQVITNTEGDNIEFEEVIKMYEFNEIQEMLKYAAVVLGESKDPDVFDMNDVLKSFMSLEKCSYHHSAKWHKRKFDGMPFGVHPYSGIFGVGYIVSHKNGIDYYVKGVKHTFEDHFYSFR